MLDTNSLSFRPSTECDVLIPGSGGAGPAGETSARGGGSALPAVPGAEGAGAPEDQQWCPGVKCYKTFFPSSLMTRPNKLEGLPLETLSIGS